MQLGFVIDHARCIGCHACTVACKSENDVPVGSFRTWVKYTERGTFPDVRRSFGVLRCNQCTDAPCVTICPVHALDKRRDGIVDIDPDRCIGCKSCLQGCPYDALYINDATGTAEKCHFCAHRTERGVAPACAVVCPTEAIIPGDFDDPQSRVSRIRAAGGLQVRKPEARTRPNVFYREADRAPLSPLETVGAGSYLWVDRQPGPQLDAGLFEAIERRASDASQDTARTVYDVGHGSPWGWRVSTYLFTKSLAAGSFLAAALLLPPLWTGAGLSPRTALGATGLALFFLLVTTVLLVADLKRPDRFVFVLRYMNLRSWLSRGTLVLMAYGTLLTASLLRHSTRIDLGFVVDWLLVAATCVAALLTACYTAWLFRQARGRVLWMRATLAYELAAHALLGGCALLILLARPLAMDPGSLGPLRFGLVTGLVALLGLSLVEGRLAPAGRDEEYARAHRLVTHGPYARLHWRLGIVAGILVPLVLLSIPASPSLWLVAAALGLVGMFVEQDILVRAGQALPIS